MNPLNNNSQPQNPKEQALNLLKQQGITVPQGMENNPQAIIQHLINLLSSVIIIKYRYIKTFSTRENIAAYRWSGI